MKKHSNMSIPNNCMECKNSRITLINSYLQCSLTGNCYIPTVMADKISEVCPLKKQARKLR